ncbi:MAG: Asp-tRNA(Asn)/Glu-tRNA(Gln) amidotransferase subunit GatC [Bacillota bacterium]
MRGLTADDVKRIAQLAKLDLSAAELQQLLPQLNDILAHVASLAQLDVAGVEPSSHGIDLLMPLRPDTVQPGLIQEAVLALAPEAQGKFVVVPKVVAG